MPNWLFVVALPCFCKLSLTFSKQGSEGIRCYGGNAMYLVLVN